MRGWTTLYSYVIGFTIEEQAVSPMPGEHDEGYHLAKRVQRLAPDQFPLALAAGAEVFTAFDDRFDHGLWLIIAGLQQSLATSKSTPAV